MWVAPHECWLHFAALHIVSSALTTFLHCGCCHLLRGTETVCTLARAISSILFILDVSGVTGCKNDKTKKRDTSLQCKLEKEDSKGPTKRTLSFQEHDRLGENMRNHDFLAQRRLSQMSQPNRKHEEEELINSSW